MRCLLIPWDGGICHGGNSCHSEGKLWSLTHRALLYRLQRFHCRNSPALNPHLQTASLSSCPPTKDSDFVKICLKSNKSCIVPERQESQVLAEWEPKLGFLSEFSPRVGLPGAALLIERRGLVSRNLAFRAEEWGGEGDHTAPGRQPLSSNPLPDVMTLSNLDHLLKHVPEQSAPCCVKKPRSPAQSQTGCWVAPCFARRLGQGHRETHTHKTLRDWSKKTPSHRNLRGRDGGRDSESERSGKRGNGRREKALEREWQIHNAKDKDTLI